MSGYHCGGAAAGIPTNPGGAFAAQGTLVGKDANYDGVIEPNEMAFIPSGGGGGGGMIPDNDCSDCVRTVTTYKTVQVPCTRNKYKVVNYTVPKVIPYTDWQTVTKTRTVTKQVPKTVYVPTPQVVPYQTQVPITKYKTIQIPKSRQLCEPYSTIVSKQIPVTKVVNVCPPQPCPPQPPCPPGPVLY